MDCINCPFYIEERDIALKEFPSAFEAAYFMSDIIDKCQRNNMVDGCCSQKDVYINKAKQD